MPSYRVESNQIVTSSPQHTWVPCVREDLYMDNEDPTALETEAVFSTPEDAETFIVAICDLMHMGGKREWFRIVKED